MANDLDLYSSGGLEPYSHHDQPLVPTAGDWGAEHDLLTDHAPMPALQPDAAQAQHLGQLGAVFMGDFSQLGHDQRHIRLAIDWFMQAVNNPPRQERKRHNYNLFEHEGDPVFHAFANFAHDHGFPARFIQNACWWVSEFMRRIDGSAAPTSPGHGRSPSLSSAKAYEASLSDAEFNQLHDINVHAAARTESTLRQRWGQSYDRNIAATNEFLAGLPEREREALDRYTTGGVHFMNSVEGIELLFNQAIGGNNLPRGGSLQTEIQAIENLMRTNRRAYNNDERLQARYRTLLDLRVGN
ncbi:hypothetical protein ACUTAF_19585 [Pseudomonas sp. SP16.1]|uniref:hypothetical protein n=1 Tax=Pseudomonas sp. SP16.1 TaxID=3458854 RepID=UPI00404589DF